MDTLPREGSTMYGVMNSSNRYSKSFGRLKMINKYFVTPLYRINLLPLLFIGRIFLLLYTTGRKSGKTRIIPIEYRKRNGKILIFSARGKYADWFKNLLANPDDFKIKIGFRKYTPSFRALLQSEKLEAMIWYTKSFPKVSKQLFGFDKKKDTVSEELLSPIAEFIEIIEFVEYISN